MSPRRLKVGGIDDPIWAQDAIGPNEPTAAPVPGREGSAQGTGAPGHQRVSRTQGDSRAPETSRATPTGTQISPAARATLVPKRVLMADPGMAADDEGECGAEGWLETDDRGAGLSAALRPLSVTCARPRGHASYHRSKPKRAVFRSGKSWVYQWADASPGRD